jgi:dolichol-phosphate mannosyltransferase
MISVILPTYNESKNLEELFDRIKSSLDVEKYEIILVDDDSPDGTEKRLVNSLKVFR